MSGGPQKMQQQKNLTSSKLVFFFNVCSFIRPDKCNAGDVLVLTKPLGTQVLETRWHYHSSSMYSCQIDIRKMTLWKLLLLIYFTRKFVLYNKFGHFY